MKKVVTTILLFALAIVPTLTVSAQKKRSPGRIAAVEKAAPPQTAFETAQATAGIDGVVVRWSMKQEVSNLGFDVYRLDSSGESRITQSAILGAATRFRDKSVVGESYEFVDPSGDANAVYFVESIGMNGQRQRTNGFLPVRVDDFKAAAPAKKADQSGKNLAATTLTLPKDLYTEVRANLSAPDPVAHRAVISRPGVKIGVRGEGFFRVTRAELQAGGFDVNGDSNLWQLYVNGIEQALNIGPNAAYIEFYGRGVDTPESDTQAYYLITGDTPGKRIAGRPTRLGTSTVVAASFPETTVRKERTSYLTQVFNGDAENYFGRVIASAPTTYSFTLAGVDPAASTAVLTIGFLGYSFDAHQIEIILNGRTLSPASSTGRQLFSTTVEVPLQWLNEGTNSIQFRATGPGGDVSFLDFVQISYPRRYAAEQNQLRFFTRNNKKTNVENFSSPNVRVFDITDDSSPVMALSLPVAPSGGGFAVSIPAGRGRVFYAVEDSGLKSVRSVTPNNPDLLQNPTNGADLVIIARRDMIAQAEAWANYRRSQGVSVKVVDTDEIYDEFNYGVLSADSIQAFLSYAASSWLTTPRYVLLIGDASYDSRNYEGTGYFNMVPTKFVTTIFIETGSDEALADFNGDGLAEMAIGRIPVRNPQDVIDILNRQITWEAAVSSPLSRGTLFAFDLPTTYDFEGMSNRIRDQLPAGTPSTSIGRASPTAQSDLIAAMNTGKYLVNYTGHGTTGAWASSNFFSNANVPQIVNAPASRSIYTVLTCLNGYFMNVSSDSMAEVLLKSGNGGAVAAWASSGETTPDVQEIMALRFYSQIGSGPANMNRLGDLISDAKTQVPGEADVRLSWALIGDPMLKVK